MSEALLLDLCEPERTVYIYTLVIMEEEEEEEEEERTTTTFHSDKLVFCTTSIISTIDFVLCPPTEV
ncbi:MAG TPA: hypothetical protein VE521_02790 [Nitrososphaera sp.]|nr:hypothetical protein [Nitrososphaera sp.]